MLYCRISEKASLAVNPWFVIKLDSKSLVTPLNEISKASLRPLTELITPALLMFKKTSVKLESVAKPSIPMRLTNP